MPKAATETRVRAGTTFCEVRWLVGGGGSGGQKLSADFPSDSCHLFTPIPFDTHTPDYTSHPSHSTLLIPTTQTSWVSSTSLAMLAWPVRVPLCLSWPPAATSETIPAGTDTTHSPGQLGQDAQLHRRVSLGRSPSQPMHLFPPSSHPL